MEKDRRKGFLQGLAVASGFAFLIGLSQAWVVRNVPYTYRTSGMKVLVGYITGHTNWYDF